MIDITLSSGVYFTVVSSPRSGSSDILGHDQRRPWFSFQISTFTLTTETPARLTADGAMLVLQVSHGKADWLLNRGDPALVFPLPTDQWSKGYYFAVPDLAGEQRRNDAPACWSSTE